MNPYTKKWLNAKCAYLWHFMKKSEEGGKVHDVMKNDWATFRGHPRMGHYRKKHLKEKKETR